ncbi:MAG TPA: GH25 family lysozyme [Caulobacteraceae bacterium]|jgi:lysozyme
MRRRKSVGKVSFSIALAALLIASSLGTSALARSRHHSHSDHHSDAGRGAHAQRGIDVSHYQGAINWRAVARDHVSFAYLKATEGVDGRDSRFARNWRGAHRAGLSVGAYHFFNFCRPGRAQAANFLAVTPRRTGALPPAVDLEPAGRCTAHLKGAVVRREVSAYLKVVEAREHRRAVLYVTPRFYSAYRRYLPDRAIWRRSIAAKPQGRSWAVWQYRARGHVAGIATKVDLDMLGPGRRA